MNDFTWKNANVHLRWQDIFSSISAERYTIWNASPYVNLLNLSMTNWMGSRNRVSGASGQIIHTFGHYSRCPVTKQYPRTTSTFVKQMCLPHNTDLPVLASLVIPTEFLDSPWNRTTWPVDSILWLIIIIIDRRCRRPDFIWYLRWSRCHFVFARAQPLGDRISTGFSDACSRRRISWHYACKGLYELH